MADARMQDLFERALLFFVGYDYGAKCWAIQLARARKNLRAEALPQPRFDFRVKRRELPYDGIGVEKLRTQKLAKEIRETGFAGGNAASDSDDCAGLRHWL